MTSTVDRTRVQTSRLLLWSGTDEDDERAVRARLVTELAAGTGPPVGRVVCRGGASGAPSSPIRGAVVVDAGCTATGLADAVAAAPVSTVRPGGPRPVALLFPGQGSQYAGMAVSLYRDEPVFRGVLDEVFDLWGEEAATIRADWLAPDDPAVEIDDVRRAQPLLFAVDLALGRLAGRQGAHPA